MNHNKRMNGGHTQGICPLCENVAASAATKSLKFSKNILGHLEYIRHKKQEFFICLSLDSRHCLIAHRVVTIGLVDVALAHPREVFAGPISDRASSIVIAHNHPSGVAEPSSQDVRVTNQLVSAGQILGIPVRDHLIITAGKYFSFSQHFLI